MRICSLIRTCDWLAMVQALFDRVFKIRSGPSGRRNSSTFCLAASNGPAPLFFPVRPPVFTSVAMSWGARQSIFYSDAHVNYFGSESLAAARGASPQSARFSAWNGPKSGGPGMDGLDVHSQKALAAFHLLANAVHPLRRLGEVPRSDESVEFYHDRPTHCFLKPVDDRLR